MSEEQTDQASAEERARSAIEQLKELRVLDLAYDMMVTLITVGYQKLGLTDETSELRDLDDAGLAIDLLGAQLDVLERRRGEAALKELRATLAQMQLAYAQAVERQRADRDKAAGKGADDDEAGGKGGDDDEAGGAADDAGSGAAAEAAGGTAGDAGSGAAAEAAGGEAGRVPDEAAEAAGGDDREDAAPDE